MRGTAANACPGSGRREIVRAGLSRRLPAPRPGRSAPPAGQQRCAAAPALPAEGQAGRGTPGSFERHRRRRASGKNSPAKTASVTISGVAEVLARGLRFLWVCWGFRSVGVFFLPERIAINTSKGKKKTKQN